MKTQYTYTVLRYIHDITTGEFANVGVVLVAPKARYASASCRPTYGRLSRMFPGMSGDSFRSLMNFIQARAEEFGDRLSSELPLSVPENALQLAKSILPPDDSSLQWSPMGSGLTENPSKTLEELYARMVMRYEDRATAAGRTDEAVWRKFRKPLEQHHVLKYLEPKSFSVQDDQVEFEYAWKNGRWHCLAPVSFDLQSTDSIREKAHKWLGQMTSVQNADEPFKVYLLVGEPQQDALRRATDRAVSILEKLTVDKAIIREPDAERFSREFAEEIERHEVSGTEK